MTVVEPSTPGRVLQILTKFQTQKCNFPHPFSELAFRKKLRYNYLDQSANKKIPHIHFEFAYFSFFLTHLESGIICKVRFFHLFLQACSRNITRKIKIKIIQKNRARTVRCDRIVLYIKICQTQFIDKPIIDNNRQSSISNIDE